MASRRRITTEERGARFELRVWLYDDPAAHAGILGMFCAEVERNGIASPELQEHVAVRLRQVLKHPPKEAGRWLGLTRPSPGHYRTERETLWRLRVAHVYYNLLQAKGARPSTVQPKLAERAALSESAIRKIWRDCGPVVLRRATDMRNGWVKIRGKRYALSLSQRTLFERMFRLRLRDIRPLAHR